jgi:2-hydroxy-6-oxonona-2,4-dienedioate hydrolase
MVQDPFRNGGTMTAAAPLDDVADTIPGVAVLERRWTALGGLRVHARICARTPSAGPPVVLVHGIGVSGRYLLPTAVRLAASVPVYVPDLPGFGLSTKPAHALTVRELADVLTAWMAAVDVLPAALLGNSFGCQVIADLAARHSGAVSRVILQGPTMDPHARSAARQLARWAANRWREPKVDAGPSLGAIVRRDYRDAGLPRVLATFREALRDRIELNLPRITAPALVVRGARDPIVPQRWADEATALLPRGRLLVVPAAAHTMNYTSPDALARATREFIAGPGTTG